MKKLQLLVLICAILCMLCSCSWMNPLNLLKKKAKTIITLPSGETSTMNYRQTDTIVFVTKSTWQMVRTWLLDILIFTLLVCLLTSILGAKYPIPKPILSLGVSLVICLIAKFFTGADWLYTGILAPVIWLGANGGWHVVMNIFKVKKITRSKFLQKKLSLRHVTKK